MNSSTLVVSGLQGLGTLFYLVPPSALLGNSTAGGAVPSADPATPLAGLQPYITRAIPYFFLLIVLEAIAGFALRGGRRVYRLNDLVHSVSLGIVQQLFGLWTKALSIAVYLHVWRHHRLVDVGGLGTGHEDWRVWVALALGCDCGYYWFHRTARASVSRLPARHVASHLRHVSVYSSSHLQLFPDAPRCLLPSRHVPLHVGGALRASQR